MHGVGYGPLDEDPVEGPRLSHPGEAGSRGHPHGIFGGNIHIVAMEGDDPALNFVLCHAQGITRALEGELLSDRVALLCISCSIQGNGYCWVFEPVSCPCCGRSM